MHEEAQLLETGLVNACFDSESESESETESRLGSGSGVRIHAARLLLLHQRLLLRQLCCHLVRVRGERGGEG